MPTSPETLQSLRTWHQGVTTSAPQWDDVELVIRLRLTSRDVATSVIWAEERTLLEHWDAIQEAAAGGAGEPTQGVASRLSGAAAARFRELADWLSDATAGGQEVGAVTEDDLVDIAEASSRAEVERAIKMVPQLRRFRGELGQMLGKVREPEPEPEPAAGTPGLPTVEETDPEASQAATPAGSSAPDEVDAPVPATPSTSTAGRSGTTSGEGFAEVDWSLMDQGQAEVAKVAFDAGDGRSLRMTWPAPSADATVSIFRVVSRDDYKAASPNMGRLVAATFDRSAVDDQEFSSPLRHVTVWVNEGATEMEARAAQPRLHAYGIAVLPVRDLVVQHDEGTVIGRWTAVEGLSRIDVFRVPIDVALANPGRHGIGQKLPAGAVTQGGFRDLDASPGTEYEYRIYSVAEVGDIEEMDFVSRRVRLEAVAEPITDLRVTPHGESDTAYDLELTLPSLGRVELYRTQQQPPGGITARVLTRSALVNAGFDAEALLPHGIDRAGDHGSVRNVPWPTGWSRAYFTPVTVLDEEHIQVGTSQTLARSTSVSHVRILERVDEQFLTFAFPAGVTDVRIYEGPSGGALGDPDQEQPIFTLSHEDYERHGGAHLTHRLRPEGCAVHVVATSYTMGQARHSAPVTVEYPGLIRVEYDLLPVEPVTKRKKGDAGPPSTVRRVVLRSSASGTGRVALVHNPRRLPLHVRDGRELAGRMMQMTQDVSMVFEEQRDLGGLGGFVRLFVEVPADVRQAVAVLDPAVQRLRCP
jgi:hypothetical protein